MLEAKAEQAGRDVTSGRSVTEPLGSSERAVARQPVAADEEEEEEKEEETPTPMALPTGKASTAAPLTKASPAKPPRRRPPSQFEPGGVPYHYTDDGRVLTEVEWSLELSSRREAETKKEREQKELRQSHARLLTLRGMLDRSGYSYTKDQIVAMLTEYSLLDWQILRHYGMDPPHWYTKRITFTNDVIAAIDKFENEWGHGAASAGPADIEGLQARQTQQENEAASWEGYSHTTESALAGAGASVTKLFTDDPKKIAAGAGLGAATGGSLGAVGYATGQQGTYSPQVEGPGPYSSPVGTWRYSGSAPTTDTLAPPPMTVPKTPEPPPVQDVAKPTVVPDAPPVVPKAPVVKTPDPAIPTPLGMPEAKPTPPLGDLGRQPFDMKAIGVPAETPQMVGKNLGAARLKPGQEALYVLRQVGGKILKPGKTSFEGIAERIRSYKNAARLENIEVEWEVYPLGTDKPEIAEYYEQKLRDALEAQGEEMPWDNTGGRLGRKGFGTPGEGVRRSKILREDMEALLRKHQGNVNKVGEELGKHGRTVRLWAESLGLDPKDFKK
jgi:hypothetical protein